MLRPILDRPPIVCVLYVAITILMTWPIVRGITRDLPGDLGDPVFVAGVLNWGSTHWLELLQGDLSAVIRFWHAPFFYPERLVTAFSEHLALHSLLTLPVFAATRNVILCYNLWFLATFTLSGLGMYLFVRELTARPAAAFVAGLAFAFAPYRAAAIPHLQVLSSHWMPFVLYGFRRYFSTRRIRPLVGGSAALWAQHLASGYYMLFFGPFVALYALIETISRGRLRDRQVWRHLAFAAGAVVVATLPFAWPYISLQRATHFTWGVRDLTLNSADLLGWLTASSNLRVWRGLQTLVKGSEGFLFPGVLPIVLSILGLAYAWRATQADDRIRQGVRVAAIFGLTTILLSFWMSLGPEIQLRRQPVGVPALYDLAYRFVPGYGVARVPARFAMITLLGTSVLAGLALAWFESRRALLIAAALLLLAESAAMPVSRNVTWSSRPDMHPADARIHSEPELPALYRFLRSLDNAVVAHLPFGLPEREIQYVYYASIHRKRIVNGYSGAFPASYVVRLNDLARATIDPRAATVRMVNDGVTHIVVHTTAWNTDAGLKLAQLFDVSRGFRRVAQFERDFVYEIIR